MRKILILAVIMVANFMLTAQVAVNTDGSSADSSAMLDVKSITKGMLIPRLTEIEIAVISNPATGLFVYNTTANKFMVNEGTPAAPLWHELPSSVATLPVVFANTQLGSDIDGEAEGDRSGTSVSLSEDGTIVAIGALFNGINDQGHVRIYEWNGDSSTWEQKGSDIDGEAADDGSGKSVSLSADGSRLAIGADLNDGNGSNAGHVRVYDWSGSAWAQIGDDIDGESAGDQSGSDISLSADGSGLAIGATGNGGNGSNAGHVRIYDWNGDSSTWDQKGDDIDGEAASDESGGSVSLSADGSRIAIGATENDGNGSNAGHVRIYDWNSGNSTWEQKGSDIDGESASDRSGESVSLSADGSRLAIGAILNDGNGSNAGHVRVYDWSGSAWAQIGEDIDGESANDQSGGSVSLSADGSRLAIGAIKNAGNGNQAGHVRIYIWSGNAWLQMGSDVDGEAAGDRCGSSVSTSADGTIIAIGAVFNGGNGIDAGHVRVFK